MAEKGSTNTNTNTKKRDSRAGMRKVTSLTAEQLERKRANDREAQRTIRARTKEHIERLERQVAELTAKGQQVDRVLERNAALEAEIAHLRQQLAMMTSRQLYPSEDERRSSTSSNPASVISSPFNSPPMTDSLPPGPSMPPLTHRMSLPQSAWHAYVPQPPPASAIPSGSGPEAPGETVAYHHQQHDIGYNNDSYRNLAYPPPSRAAPTSHHQQHMPVATLGYDSSIPALQATHLPVPSHLQQQQQPQQQQQQQHAYPSNLVHSPPSQTHIGYQWDSRG